MITLCANYVGQEKSMSRNDDSTANQDVIAKGAVINFFKSLLWFEKIPNRELKNRNIREPPNLKDVLFRGSQVFTLALVTKVCMEQTQEEKLIHLIHGNY